MNMNLKQPPHIILPGDVLNSTVIQLSHITLFIAADEKVDYLKLTPKRMSIECAERT